MSLSQKHFGKVLVPWFNIAEWKQVYGLIYCDNGQNWPKALEILKIWKHRTPLLSAGVEGTLIILEALLVDSSQLSEYENSHIFSTSLVRFLNLCAAGSDRQGTFYKTAMKNELPKWLISLRHEIAHSHKVPSKSMLELSLKFCLKWLKGKYWDVQYGEMADFVVNNEENNIVEHAIFVYNNLIENEDIRGNKELLKCLNTFTRTPHKQVNFKKAMEAVEDSLLEELRVNREKSFDKICIHLVDTCIILSVNWEMDKEGNRKIPHKFLAKWNNLLNVMYEGLVMPNFVSCLFNFILDDKHNEHEREIASFWIKEIFKGLNKKENNSQDEEGLLFKTENNSLKVKSFATEILAKLTPFTLNFLKEVLDYNDAPVQFIEDSIELVTAFSAMNKSKISRNDQIFTISDLKIGDGILDDGPNKQTPTQRKSRWTLIEDTSEYTNLPLGILPHQDRSRNPVLAM